ncbi:hypothetical protein HMPREF1554_01721 [Porphyromonas gingivalis F0569]|nr:hypothetical protein HMPREF1554_01721 [Porphyromonas gingivalis F0569]
MLHYLLLLRDNILVQTRPMTESCTGGAKNILTGTKRTVWK